VNTPEIGDTTIRGFYDPSMLSANMGTRGSDGNAVIKMLDVGGIVDGKQQLGRLENP
jgi:hypothetical protein